MTFSAAIHRIQIIENPQIEPKERFVIVVGSLLLHLRAFSNGALLMFVTLARRRPPVLLNAHLRSVLYGASDYIELPAHLSSTLPHCRCCYPQAKSKCTEQERKLTCPKGAFVRALLQQPELRGLSAERRGVTPLPLDSARRASARARGRGVPPRTKGPRGRARWPLRSNRARH